MPSPNSSMSSSSGAARERMTLLRQKRWRAAEAEFALAFFEKRTFLLRSLLREATGPDTVPGAGCGEEMLISD